MEESDTIILKNELFLLTKAESLNHLKLISNQDAEVPISDHDYVSVRNLISEVEMETAIGIKYMIEWTKTTSVITNIRRKKKESGILFTLTKIWKS